MKVIRGIHPLTKKLKSGIYWKNSAIKVMPAPEKVYISLSQHIGKPATPLVSVGQSVLVGERIAVAGGSISANIHSPVSGTVIDITEQCNMQGNVVTSIVIDNDNQYNSIKFEPVSDINRESILAAAEDMGITGMGGAAFPTHVKLSPKQEIDYIIINGAECEPYITADNRLMLECSDEIVKGALLAGTCVKAKEVIIGIEGNKPQAIKAMRNAAVAYTGVSVKVLPEIYPMGSEKQLIYNLTGRTVKSGDLPSSVGCVVQNVATVKALYDAVYNGYPVTGRVTTVAGSAVPQACNLFIPIGTRICDVLDYLGIDAVNIGKVISGGPMMGFAVADLHAAVTKGTSALLILNEKDAIIPDEQPCIRCGRCVSVCPMRLSPVKIDCAQRSGNTDACVALHAYDCIECGSCTFICPAKRYLMQSIRLAKVQALNKIRGEKK